MKRRSPRTRNARVAGGENEPADAPAQHLGRAGRYLEEELGAAPFVGRVAGRIDGIVEPQRELHGVGVAQQRDDLVHVAEAIADVVEVVEAALRCAEHARQLGRRPPRPAATAERTRNGPTGRRTVHRRRRGSSSRRRIRHALPAGKPRASGVARERGLTGAMTGAGILGHWNVCSIFSGRQNLYFNARCARIYAYAPPSAPTQTSNEELHAFRRRPSARRRLPRPLRRRFLRAADRRAARGRARASPSTSAARRPTRRSAARGSGSRRA